MIYQYVCPICAFFFQVLKPYTTYKCPSCSVVVQAVEYKPEMQVPQVNEANWRMN